MPRWPSSPLSSLLLMLLWFSRRLTRRLELPQKALCIRNNKSRERNAVQLHSAARSADFARGQFSFDFYPPYSQIADPSDIKGDPLLLHTTRVAKHSTIIRELSAYARCRGADRLRWRSTALRVQDDHTLALTIAFQEIRCDAMRCDAM